MSRGIERWNGYWFPLTTTLNLAGARIVAVGVHLLFLFPSLDYHINLAVKNTAFTGPQPIIRLLDALLPREALFTPGGLTAIYWLTALAGVAALIGLFTRTALFILALGTWFFVSHAYSYGDVHHPQAIFAIFLMTLPFAPAGAALSVDALRRHRRDGRAGGMEPPRSELAMWPLKLLHVLLAATYFSTGITKLLSGGLQWMNGYTLQNHIFSDAINRDIALGIWLAQQHELCILLAIGTILFELFFFVSILLPRTAPLFFVSGILFHVGLLVTSGHPFFEHMLMNVLLLLFLDPERFPWPLRRADGRLAPQPT